MRFAIAATALLLVAACSAPPTPRPDPFFGLPLEGGRDGARSPAADATSDDDAEAYRVSLRFFPDVPGFATAPGALGAPVLLVRPGEPARIDVTNSVSYVQDFELEVAEDAWIAEPRIEAVCDGLFVELVARQGDAPGEAVLSWHVRVSDLSRPIPVRNVLLGDGTSTGTLQLPAVRTSEAAGRTRLRFGEETRLGRVPAWPAWGAPMDLTVTARIEPVPFPGRPGSADHDADAAPGDHDPVLSVAKPLPPGTAPIEIAVVRLSRVPQAGTLHLSRTAAERVLPSLGFAREKSFVLDTPTEEGTRVACVLEQAYVGDFDVEVSSTAHLVDPVVKRIRVGFDGRVENRDGIPTLVWSMRSLTALDTCGTMVAGRRAVRVDVPSIAAAAGTLPIRSHTNLVAISPLATGGALAVLVRTAPSSN
jgi:hypothetical protein